MSSRLKSAILVLVDLCIGVYIVLAFSAFNKPEEKFYVCKDVKITVEDAATNGFLNAEEVKVRMQKAHLYPKGRRFSDVSCRKIEEMLKTTPFVNTAECYKTQDGVLNVYITQRLPVIRIKNAYNQDFYIDDKDCIMPKSDYTSDMMIATGYISQNYATAYISPLARAMMNDDFCRNLFEQINVTSKHEVELVPRVGNHTVMLGHLPESKSRSEREALINEFVKNKMNRLKLFYKYGLKEAGWNKYSEVNIEFDNQIICTRIDEE